MSYTPSKSILLASSLCVLLTVVNFAFLYHRLGDTASWISFVFAIGLAILAGLIPRVVSLPEHSSFMRYYVGFIIVFGGMTCSALIGYYLLHAEPIYFYLLAAQIMLFLVWILLYFYFK